MKTKITDPEITQNLSHKYLGAFGMLWLSFLIMSTYTSFKTFDIFGLTLTVAVLTYPFTYIFSDIFTEVYGYRVSRKIVWSGFVCVAMTAAIGYLYNLVPGSSTFVDSYSFNLVFGSSPTIVFFLIVGFFLGESVNSIVLAKMKLYFKGGNEELRYITSTFFGQLVDNSVFWSGVVIFASLIPKEQMISVISTSVIFCVLVEMIMIPVTKPIIKWIKEQEGIDTYDHGTNFNPFKIG